MTASGVSETAIELRLADITDLPAVAAMHQRCSPASRYRRYLSGVAVPSRRHLANLVAPRHGYAVVAEAGDSAVVGLGNLMWVGVEAEVAVLVEDAWQRRGVGTALLRRLHRLGAEIGIRAIYLHTHPDNVGLVRVVNNLGVPVEREYEDGLLTLRVAVGEPCLAGATRG